MKLLDGKRILIVLCLLLAAMTLSLQTAFAQDEATPASTLSSEDAIATIEALQDEIEDLAQQVELDSEVIDIRAESLDTSFNTLEAIISALSFGGLLFGALSAIFAFLGFRNLSDRVAQVDEVKKQVDAASLEVHTSKTQAEQLRGELEEIRDEAKAQVAQISQNRKNVQLTSTLQYVAQNQYETGDLEGALELYDRMLEIDPENLWALYMKGYILTKTMELDRAADVLQKALSIDSEFYYALAARGFVKRRRGDEYDEEMKTLDPSTSAYQDAQQARDDLYKEASADLDRALGFVEKLVDADGESWRGALGGLYKRQGNLQKALNNYRLAAAVTPNSSYPIINRAILELKQGDENYVKSFIRVLKIADSEIIANPDDYWPYGDIVIARLILDEADKAAECFEEMEQLIPETVTDVLPRIWDTLTEAAVDLRHMGKETEAAGIDAFVAQRLPQIGDAS
ncbi:tetratricopeptide repeat protein [Phototrophicus methaneseepsis]|uniref:Tetratricopeptide repeat protein n=1 Tax=Phototrophicus methaneseepsis TaxID=2710758 RepID=A0A7S8IG81_9CHLR|nr:tetratricopeptide repeat protein [Phototrophicus methaneseepsis]QPC84436.1 tetratricopeptide repeat protein [Phototrophicus methaneseepsis]